MQATTYPSLSMASHPNGTYSTGATSFNTQLPHHNYTVPQTTSLPMYSTTSYHSTLGGLTSVPQSVLPFSTGQSTFATSGTTYSTTIGTNAFGTSGVTSGRYKNCNLIIDFTILFCFSFKENKIFF